MERPPFLSRTRKNGIASFYLRMWLRDLLYKKTGVSDRLLCFPAAAGRSDPDTHGFTKGQIVRIMDLWRIRSGGFGKTAISR
jgi:hypothetical protein